MHLCVYVCVGVLCVCVCVCVVWTHQFTQPPPIKKQGVLTYMGEAHFSVRVMKANMVVHTGMAGCPMCVCVCGCVCVCVCERVRAWIWGGRGRRGVKGEDGCGGGGCGRDQEG